MADLAYPLFWRNDDGNDQMTIRQLEGERGREGERERR
jgi:hypothetical protein